MQQLPIDFENPIESNISVNKLFLKTIPYNSPEIQSVISNTYIGQSLKEDTLGKLFEKLIDEAERKNLGQFYTPTELVDYIIEFLDIKPDSKILDPTCGCGVFLTTVYKHLRKINKHALRNIYGVDLNKTAVELARTNLWLKDKMQEKSLEVLEQNIKIGNSIIDDKILCDTAFNWYEEFDHVLQSGGFDFIIGNPPYVTLKNGIDFVTNDPFFSQIINGPVNAASLIIMRSLQLLKNGGIMAFVLPKTLLRVGSYSKLREFILNSCQILRIVDLGTYFPNVRGEQILLFVKKSVDTKTFDKNPVLIKIFSANEKPISPQKEFYVKQGLFRKYNNFLIFEDKKLYSLIDKIGKTGQSLNELAEIFRGLTLSPSSDLIRRQSAGDLKPIIKGNDVIKFGFKTKYFINPSTVSGNSKLSKLKQKKIILQNIFSAESGIISAFDTQGHITFDTVTNVVIKTNEISYKYLLGLLNSKLMNFYLIFALFNKSKLTMHTDAIYLGKLPIIVSGIAEQKKIEGLVVSLETLKDKTILRELDRLVFKMYGIDDCEQKIIDESLRSIMSSKSFC